jgi:hypothetical protein
MECMQVVSESNQCLYFNFLHISICLWTQLFMTYCTFWHYDSYMDASCGGKDRQFCHPSKGQGVCVWYNFHPNIYAVNKYCDQWSSIWHVVGCM